MNKKRCSSCNAENTQTATACFICGGELKTVEQKAPLNMCSMCGNSFEDEPSAEGWCTSCVETMRRKALPDIETTAESDIENALRSRSNVSEGCGKVPVAIAICIMLMLGFWAFYEPEIEYGPGVLVPENPIQEKVKDMKPWKKGKFTITPLASYHIKARVLSRTKYSDSLKEISRLDLALGWGEMSDSSVLSKLSIRQSGRWYFFSYSLPPPIPGNRMARQSANTHILPATDEVDNIMSSVIKGDIVELDGYLISANDDSRAPAWKSSLSRRDTGDKSCEIMWVEKATIMPRP